MSEFDPASFHKCNTCKAIFSSLEKVKEHYKGDWHIFNAKRRSNGLASVSKQDFKTFQVKIQTTKKPEATSSIVKDSGKCTPNKISGTSDATPKLTAIRDVSAEVSSSPDSDRQSFDCLPIVAPVAIAKMDTGNDQVLVDSDKVLEEDEADEADEDVEETLPLGSNISIFDDKVFDSTEKCVEYMVFEFGFFIPDVEYLIDLPGLLEYLGEKVKLGGICLYCQKRFGPGRPCQNHMKSKSHCKIAYEEDVDMDEFEDFYDYASSYDNLDDGTEGKSMEISPLGELVLLDGRTVGHRDFRRYYKQHYRPQDTRESILAVQQEELRVLGAQFGGQKITAEDMLSMPHVELSAMLVKYHKAIRRGQMIEQRGAQHRDWLDKKRENQSKVEKARSSATTTAKIRDYHRSIM